MTPPLPGTPHPSETSPALPQPQPNRPRLLEELRGGRRDLAKTGGAALLVSVVGFCVAFWFVEPPPPREIVIAAGPASGHYYATAQAYARHLEEHGVTLTVLETAGSVENYRLLLEENEVEAAIVQGGAAPRGEDMSRVEALGTLFVEPLWLFYRADLEVDTLRDLAGCRVAVGDEGSGCFLLVSELLEANGVVPGSTGPNATGGDEERTQLYRRAPARGVEMLRAGDVDAAFLVLSPASPRIADLLADGRLKLLSIDRAAAYARRRPKLRRATLARGVVDLAADLPPEDVTLVAPTASLVVTQHFHDALIPLLLEAAEATHAGGDLISGPGEHPSLAGVEAAPSAVATHYYKHGPSFFQRYLGFWMASLIDRAKIMVVPLIVLTIPAFKLWPPVYRWRIRSRIYRWYAILREIDQQLRDGAETDYAALKDRLEAMEHELEDVSVPLSYMEEFYHLRSHIDLVLRRIDARLA
ncbi:MAG: TAXI family TRAP transporter solute-binding subunit [Planctomycetota bacterium]